MTTKRHYFAGVLSHMLADDDEDETAPRCEGCGDRAPLTPYTQTTSDGGQETMLYCDDCRAVADEEW